MAREKLTAGRIADFKCEPGKSQSFLWDTEAPGLGLRVTANNAKSYIFQAKLKGDVIRITIGNPSTWRLDRPMNASPNQPSARSEARRLKGIIDSRRDPRRVAAEELANAQALRDAEEVARTTMQLQQMREAFTVAIAWREYVAERTPLWSARHALDHDRLMQAGGTIRTRSPKLTEPGPLYSLAHIRLIDLTMERVEVWARVEAVKRPTRARLALRLLKAFLFWCAAHRDYAELTKTNAAKSKKARECLGKPKAKNDVLQREQLHSWFAAVRQIRNPVISAYLQCLLLLGCRREELANLRWGDVDFKWKSIRLNDKVADFRIVPLPPYVSHLLASLPKRSEWVFHSPTAASGRLAEPRMAHNEALAIAGLPHLTLHGLRRSFASLSEWTETPAGVAAQIQGHAPQGVREQNYIRRPLDLLRGWHIKIEQWVLKEAGIDFTPAEAGLRVVPAA